jgi:DNA-binding XRE family transcriptional regulator
LFILQKEGEMPNLAQVLKDEILRLSRKEVRAVTTDLQVQISKLKKIVSAQKKNTLVLEKELAKVKKKLERKNKATTPTEDEVTKSRVSPASIARLRKKLGLTRSDMASIIDVNPNSIYLWEQGRATPRVATKAKIISLRSMGKRDVKNLLEEKA